MSKINVTVVQGRNLASSRTIFCEVNMVDQNGKIISAPQHTQQSKATNSPTWDETLSFDVEEGFSGFTIRCYEWHRFFSDKFLGIVMLKFNTERLLAGKDKVDSWFTLSSPKKKSLGDLQVKVECAALSGSSKSRQTKIKESSEEDVSEPEEEHPRPVISGKLWNSQNGKLQDSIVVVINDENGEGAKHRDLLNKDENSTSTTASKTTNQDSSKGSKKEKTEEKSENSEKGSKEKSENSKDSFPTVKISESSDQSDKQDEVRIPQTRKGQVEFILETIKKYPNESIIDNLSFDKSYATITFKCIDRKKHKDVEVALIVPDDIRKGEYTLWASDGGIELGCTGSILRAFNKIISIFAAKNNVEPCPLFPEPPKTSKSMIMTTSWAEIKSREPEKPSKSTPNPTSTSTQAKKVDDDDDDFTDPVWDLTGDYTDEGPQEFLTQPKLNFMKYVDKYKSLHKGEPYEGVGVVTDTATGDYFARILLNPSVFLEPLLASVWFIKYDKPIVVEIQVQAPYYMESTKAPNITVWQSRGDVNKADCVKETFGLAWYLQKRTEEFVRKNWPPPSTGSLFVDMISFVTDKITMCAENCLICGKSLEFSMLKPSICEQAICVFGMEQYGLGVDPVAEIHTSPEVVDLLISFTYASAAASDPRRFTPFPRHVEVSRIVLGKETKHRLQANPSAADPLATDLTLVLRVMNTFPTVTEMSSFKNSQELKEHMDKSDPLAFPLLRWILTSNRAHLAKLQESEKIKEMSTKHQFLLLSSTPAKEKKFQEEKKRKGSFYAFHGSDFKNWHSIMRTGLRNLSGTALMSTGQAYGSGIYMATDCTTSMGYAKVGGGWPKSMFNEDGVGQSYQVLALCEVISGYTANPYYVVPNEDHVVTRYLFLFNGRTPVPGPVQAANVKIPNLEFSKYQKQF